MRFTLALFLALALGGSPAFAQEEEERQDPGAIRDGGVDEDPAGDDLSQALRERLQESAAAVRGMQGIHPDLFEQAECVAVIPSAKEGAFLIGYQYGRGVIACREGANIQAVAAGDADTEPGAAGGRTQSEAQGLGGRADITGQGWTAPSMVRLDSASIGLQAGGTETDLVVLFMDSAAVESFLGGDMEFGVDVQAVAGPAGDQPARAIDEAEENGVVTYGRSGGLFAGISLDGASLRPDDDANEALYGAEVDARTLLSGARTASTPPEAAQFLQAIESAGNAVQPGNQGDQPGQPGEQR
jgi:lipid-binding SYLF domain-containing protein